jgi:hypothetical protein
MMRDLKKNIIIKKFIVFIELMGHKKRRDIIFLFTFTTQHL